MVKKLVSISYLLLAVSALSLVLPQKISAVCDPQIYQTSCGTAGQKPYRCQERIAAPSFCCDLPNECKPQIDPSHCPPDRIEYQGECCKGLTGGFPNTTDCIPFGNYCSSGYAYDPGTNKCAPVTTLPGAGIQPTGCDTPAGPKTGIETAIGCINVSGPEGFVSSILSLAIGIGGGIAFLLIIFGAFQILTSSGNPEKVKAGKELITSAIAGLLLIIFSVFILRLLGAEILEIPGFG